MIRVNQSNMSDTRPVIYELGSKIFCLILKFKKKIITTMTVNNILAIKYGV